MPTNSISDEMNESLLDELALNAKDYCVTNGLVMFVKTEEDQKKNVCVNHSPVALLPSKFPKKEFDFITSLQNEFNRLIYLVANDYEFLNESFKNIRKIDDFSNRLFTIYETVLKEGIAQPISLNIMRNDFILDLNKIGKETLLSQIEYNTISCASGAACSLMTKLHSYVLRVAGREDLINKQAPNNNLETLAEGLVKSWQLYGNQKALLVFLVRKIESNIGDQRILEQKCQELNPKCRIRRFFFDDFVKYGKIDDQKRLFINEHEIGLVYFRAAYDPFDYPTEKEWQARLLIERSKAIKCPTINYHLSGFKKVQQVLTKPGVIEKYIPDKSICDQIRATFVEQHSFEEIPDDDFIKMMIDNCEDYVLKPQREGGGNKFFGSEIKKFLATHDRSHLTGYVLMKLVKGLENENYLLKPGMNLTKKSLISEMGVFGVLIGDSTNILHNKTGGYLLRSKLAEAQEGGVGIGTAVLDSIQFY